MKALRDRLQFTITLALFFPVILDSLLGFGSEPVASKEMILKWGVVIAALIFDYLIIEIKDWKVNEKLVTSLNRLLLMEILMFAVICFVFASLFQNGNIPTFYDWSLRVSLVGVIAIPLIIFIILAGNIVFRMYKSITRDIV